MQVSSRHHNISISSDLLWEMWEGIEKIQKLDKIFG